jgi:hypothetical protein
MSAESRRKGSRIEREMVELQTGGAIAQGESGIRKSASAVPGDSDGPSANPGASDAVRAATLQGEENG